MGLPKLTPEAKAAFDRKIELADKYDSLFLQILPEKWYDTNPSNEFTEEELIDNTAAGAYNLDENCGLWLMCMKHVIPRLVLPKDRWDKFDYQELKEAITKQYNTNKNV